MRHVPLALSERDRRALHVGALTILGLVLVGRGLPWWRAWTAASERRATAAVVRLARDEALLRDAAAAARAVAVQRAALARADSGLLVAANPSTAAAALAGTVSAAAAHVGVTLGSLTPGADSVGDASLVRVRVQTTATGDIATLSAFLAALEGAVPWIRVRSLHCTQPNPGAPDAQMESLQVTLTVDALARVRHGSAP